MVSLEATVVVGSEATTIEPFRKVYGGLVAGGCVIVAIAWRLRGKG